ncbi:MAG: hypothetical protein ABI652_05660 [Acidobacteriota bacterium]
MVIATRPVEESIVIVVEQRQVDRTGHDAIADVVRMHVVATVVFRQQSLRVNRNLAEELTSFVGRRQELAELPKVHASSRLLSLAGAGGVGKTRLAMRLARQLIDEFRDGVWLVDLAPLALPELLAQTVASTPGFREGPQRSARDVLIDTLRDRQLLLVLDTCEHLIASCAELVETVLHEAPGVRILATARRYRLLETVRQYARERLVHPAEAAALRDRHFEFFFDGFRDALTVLRHEQPVAGLKRVRLEQENLRAALDWALTSVSFANQGLELAAALFWFWTKRSLYAKGKLWLERALAAAAPAPQVLRARALLGLAHMHHFQGRPFDRVPARCSDP